MAKRQSRRSISLQGATYWALRVDCGARHVSLSEHLEALIAADLEARRLTFLIEVGRLKVGEIKQQQARESGPRVLSRVRESGSAQRPSPAPPSASVPAPAAPQAPPRASTHPSPQEQSAVAPRRGGSGQAQAGGGAPLPALPPASPPAEGLREPGPVLRRLSRQELADQRAFARSGGKIPEGRDDLTRSGRAPAPASLSSRSLPDPWALR